MKLNKKDAISWVQFIGILVLSWMMQSDVVRSQPTPIAKIPQLSEINQPLTSSDSR